MARRMSGAGPSRSCNARPRLDPPTSLHHRCPSGGSPRFTGVTLVAPLHPLSPPTPSRPVPPRSLRWSRFPQGGERNPRRLDGRVQGRRGLQGHSAVQAHCGAGGQPDGQDVHARARVQRDQRRQPRRQQAGHAGVHDPPRRCSHLHRGDEDGLGGVPQPQERHQEEVWAGRVQRRR